VSSSAASGRTGMPKSPASALGRRCLGDAVIFLNVNGAARDLGLGEKRAIETAWQLRLRSATLAGAGVIVSAGQSLHPTPWATALCSGRRLVPRGVGKSAPAARLVEHVAALIWAIPP